MGCAEAVPEGIKGFTKKNACQFLGVISYLHPIKYCKKFRFLGELRVILKNRQQNTRQVAADVRMTERWGTLFGYCKTDTVSS